MAASVSKEVPSEGKFNGLFAMDEGMSAGESQNRTIRASEYLSVKHALPKTNIANVILYENTSQERHLTRKLSGLKIRKERHKNVLDLQRRAFVQRQTRKMKKWKREDEFSLNNMNLPSLNGRNRPSSIQIVYRNPDYQMKTNNESKPKSESSVTEISLPPLVEIRREKTEIVLHKDKTFITKLPTSFSLNQNTLRHHLRYCGNKYLTKGQAAMDDRFQRLKLSLAPTLNRSDEQIEVSLERRDSTLAGRRESGVDHRRKRSAQVVIPLKRVSTMAGESSFGSSQRKSLSKIERSKTDAGDYRRKGGK